MGYVFRPRSLIFIVSLDAQDRVTTLCGGIRSDQEADPPSTLPSRSPAELVQFLKPNVRDYFETDEVIFIHGSYDRNKPMTEQFSTTLQREFVEPEKSRPQCSGKIVVAGHTPQTSGELLDHCFLKVLNKDCSRGGWLTALELHSADIIQANLRSQVRRPAATPT
jgi:serine/threonine protein phosphatase 1